MKITKPDTALILLGYHSRAGQPQLFVTVGYALEADGTQLTEQEAWAWLMPQFPAEPFDTAQKKSRGTFAVGGCAFAPAGSPGVASLAVRARVGELEKTLHVHGDRRWTRTIRGWQASPATAFTRMPLDLTHAFGGKAWDENPHGLGFTEAPDGAEGLPLPNVELPGAPLLAPTDRPAPATFGPLPQGAPARARFLGTFDEAWRRTRFPWLPDDTDPRWFDAVPQDQCRAGYWRGDETWSAHGMHPEQSVVEGRLPGLRPRLLFRPRAAAGETVAVAGEARLDLDTVWLFPNQRRAIVLYRAAIPVREEDAGDLAALGIFTETLAEPAQPVEYWDARWREAEAPPAPPPDPVPVAAAQADAEAAAAKARAQAEAMADEIWQSIAAAHEEGLAEAARQMKAAGLPFDPAKYPLPSRPALALGAAAAASPLPASFAADLTREIESSLAAARAEAEDKLREVARHTGQDAERLVELSRNPPPAQDIDVREELRKAPIPEAEKQKALARLNEFDKSMAELDRRIAELDAGIAAMHARSAAASGAGRTEGAVREALEAANVDGEGRVRLDRDALLARHERGEPLTRLRLEGVDVSGMDLSGADFSDSVLTDCNLARARLDGARFVRAVVERTNLDEASLAGAILDGAIATDCGLRGARLSGARLEATLLAGCGLDGAELTGARAARLRAGNCTLRATRLDGIQAGEAEFDACDLTDADLGAADLSRARFNACVFDRTRLSGAGLAGVTLSALRGIRADFTGAAARGLRVDTACALQAPAFDRADLTDASLQDSSLTEASLHETLLDRALVKNCDLSRADAWRASARRADFNASRLTGGHWVAANLMGASLHKTILDDVDLSGANLHAAETRTATVRGLRLDGALLTRCRLLEEHAHD